MATYKYLWDASVLVNYAVVPAQLEKLAPFIPLSAVSTVNLQEVISSLLRRYSIKVEDTKLLVEKMHMRIVSFREHHVALAAQIHANGLKYNLSYADAACIAIGQLAEATIITADRAWLELHCDADIKLVR